MRKYYLIGIKGAGMSALAHILHDMGNFVSGSDIKDMIFTQVALEAKGIEFDVFGHTTIDANMHVIIGNAFNEDHVDVQFAKKIGARIIRYHDFLGELASHFTSIAISGTHGKTTTTGMMAHVLRLSCPTAYLIGDGSGKGVINGKYFAFEACEYKRHFLAYHPDYLIITNIEHDHPDYFKDVDDVLSAFRQAASQCKKKVIMCGDDKNVMKLNIPNGLTYGVMEHNDVIACNIIKDASGTIFDVVIKDKYFYTFKTPFFGDHMVLNSLAVIAVCYLEEMNPKIVAKDLSLFSGVKRRFNEKIYGNQIIIDDYAHHPTEIRVTLQAARQKYPHRPLIAVFQPHTYTRTATFVNEFKETLALADHVYLTDIFGSARESKGEFDIHILLDGNERFNHLTFDNIDQLKQYDDGVLIFMGAGDIEKYEQAYVNLGR